HLESNWYNVTYTIYLNDSIVATSSNDPVTLNFTREMNVGVYNLTIFADGGTQTYTVNNIRYIVTEEGVSYDYSVVSGGHSYIEGDTYEGDTYIEEGDELPTDVIIIPQDLAATIAIATWLVFMFAALWMDKKLKTTRLETEQKGQQ
ncbi:unnamed protein product, partial [marine sediment metagenome]